MFNRSTSNSHKYWIAYNKVTIDKDYTLKLITNYTNDYYYYYYSVIIHLLTMVML
ncbi:MAG: hypothetical protein IJ481_03985 [Alphaproteobacteria bacterium]|nr:hypothetical protein [Alphaproteobacteria bacterium]